MSKEKPKPEVRGAELALREAVDRLNEAHLERDRYNGWHKGSRNAVQNGDELVERTLNHVKEMQDAVSYFLACKEHFAAALRSQP